MDNNLSFIMDKFDRYLDLAKNYEANNNVDLAKRNYYLAAKQLLLASNLSTKELKASRKERAMRLIKYADNLENVINNKKHLSTPNKNENNNDEKLWQSVEIPNVSFDDVIGLEKAKEEVRIAMIYPINYPDKYKIYHKESGGGVLLYGPPGTGKTMLAKAIAHEVGAKFYLVRSSDIVSKWVGDSEKNIASLFNQVRQDDRAIIFIDEMDTLFASRGQDIHNDRRVNEFLQQIDGFVSKNPNLLILGSTNKPWDVDSAAMRSGRFSTKIYIPLPNYDDRLKIIKKYTKDIPLDYDVNLNEIARLTNYFSGADLFNLCDRAKQRPLVESFKSNNIINIKQEDFLREINYLKNTININEIKQYEDYAGIKNKENVNNDDINLNTINKEELIVKQDTFILNPNHEYQVEFYLSGEHKSIYIEVNKQKVMTSKDIKNYKSNVFKIESCGEYEVLVYENNLINKFKIKIVSPIEELDLGI